MKFNTIVVSSLAALLFQSSSTFALAIPDTDITIPNTDNPRGIVDTDVPGVKVDRDGAIFEKRAGTNTYCQKGSYYLPYSNYYTATYDMKNWLNSHEWWGDKKVDFWSGEVCAFIRNKGNTQNFPGNAFQADLDRIRSTCGERIAGFVAHDDWKVNYGVFNCVKEYPGI
jgi:hypothetical protein